MTGVLPVTASRPTGSVAATGDVQRLSCDQALELVDALLLVVTRMDAMAEERLGAPIEGPCEEEAERMRYQPADGTPTPRTSRERDRG
jgi:hypothetical protein